MTPETTRTDQIAVLRAALTDEYNRCAWELWMIAARGNIGHRRYVTIEGRLTGLRYVASVLDLVFSPTPTHAVDAPHYQLLSTHIADATETAQ